MAQAGTFDPGPVIRAEFTVTVEGITREVESMSWGCDMTGGLPKGAVSMGTGIRSWSGRIVWAQDTPVKDSAFSPRPDWFEDIITGGTRATMWPPRNGDRVVVEVRTEGQQWTMFTGRIGETVAGMDGALTSQVWSTIGDKLKSEVSINPTSGVASSGLPALGFAIAVQAFEQAGMGLVPGVQDRRTFAHISFQAGYRAIVGNTRMTGLLGQPTLDGLYVGDDVTVDARGKDLKGYPTVVGRIHPGSEKAAFTITIAGNNRAIKMEYTKATDSYSIYVDGQRQIGPIPRRDSDRHPVMGIQLRGSTVQYWFGRSYGVASSSIYTASSSSSVSHVHIHNLLALEGWYGLYNTALNQDLIDGLSDEPVRYFSAPVGDVQRAGATRGFENAQAGDVVSQWSEATLNSVWETETGEVVAMSRPYLIAQTPVRVVEVSEKVFDGSHLIGGGDIHRRVVIHGQESTLEQSPDDRFHVTVYEPARDAEFPAGRQPLTLEWFANAATDEDWGPIDLGLTFLGSSARYEDARFGSLYAATAIENDQDTDRFGTWIQSARGMSVSLRVERLGQRTLKFTATVRKTGTGYDYNVFLKTPPNASTLVASWRDRPMPVIRADWKTVWTDYVDFAGDGPQWAPEFHWHPEWWLIREDAATVAAKLALELRRPLPAFTGVSLLWDPTRQLGDVETWRSTDSDGEQQWETDVLITAYTTQVTDGVPSQVVDGQIIALRDARTGKTYRDLAAAYASYGAVTGTYQQVYDALPGTP